MIFNGYLEMKLDLVEHSRQEKSHVQGRSKVTNMFREIFCFIRKMVKVICLTQLLVHPEKRVKLSNFDMDTSHKHNNGTCAHLCLSEWWQTVGGQGIFFQWYLCSFIPLLSKLILITEHTLLYNVQIFPDQTLATRLPFWDFSIGTAIAPK